MSDKRKRCERCGTDLTIYKKIYRSSNLFYNNGLARARVRDLSGAVISLRKSLDFNKANTNARNLLGLVYYEMGETVAALSEWVISRHFQSVDNDADEYINKVQSNPTKLDALNQAIKRYNTALNYAKQGSDDLAIIQLKKVVSLNPHFIRAYQLLALLLMKTGENERAKKYLMRAGKIDVSNTITLRYMHELEAPASVAKDPEANPEAAQSITNTIMPISSYKEDKPNIIAFVNLVIGVIIGIAVTAFLIIPTVKKSMASDQNSDMIDYGSSQSQLEEKDKKLQTLQEEYDALVKDKEQLQSQLDNIDIPEDKSQLYETLFNSAEQYLTELAKAEKDRDFITIADSLAGIDETKLESQSAVALLNNLRQATYPIVAEIHYDNGHEFYSDKKYTEALAEFKKAMVFDPKDVDAIYFTARTYDRLDDKENAIVYYSIVVNDYADTDRYTDAAGFLEDLQK
jgi:tetratricopeptide (TPR) repeat protein